jgi:hypothetical protein
MRRRLAPILLLASATLAFAACDKVHSPTEPNQAYTPPAPSSLSGTARDQNGVPYGGGATVNCQGKWVVADSTGRFQFLLLQPGKTQVLFTVPGRFAPQAFDVELSQGPNTRDFSIEVFHGEPATMSGTVRNYNNQPPPPNTTVTCQGKVAQVQADGTYFLPGLESGDWIAVAAIGSGDSSQQGVTLAAGSNTKDFYFY